MSGWTEIGIVAVLLFRIVYTDVKRNQIENRVIGLGLATGFVCAYIRGGWMEILLGAKWMSIIIAVMFFLFVLKGLGAGDIKLFGMLALFFPQKIILIVMISFFVGAGIAVGRIFIRTWKREVIYRYKETINFSIPIALSTGIVEAAGIILQGGAGI